MLVDDAIVSAGKQKGGLKVKKCLNLEVWKNEVHSVTSFAAEILMVQSLVVELLSDESQWPLLPPIFWHNLTASKFQGSQIHVPSS